jgi:tetratricopeptide (TPR) repeat protein
MWLFCARILRWLARLLCSRRSEYPSFTYSDESSLDLRFLGGPTTWVSLARTAMTFHVIGHLDPVDGAIGLYRQALEQCPQEEPARSSLLFYLAVALQDSVERLGDMDLLTEAIYLHRQALDLRPPGHSEHLKSLSSLAIALRTRYEKLCDIDSLTEAIDLLRQARDMHPPGHPDRPTSLRNLATALMMYFLQLGDIDTLEEAVDLHRQVLGLSPRGRPSYSMSLNNLASVLRIRFDHLGDISTLEEAIDLHRQALRLRPPGHPDRPDSLDQLAAALWTSFHELGITDILVEAVGLNRQALDLRPHGHTDRSVSLHNLAVALRTRFEQFGDNESLAEAVDLHRESLRLLPPGHSDYSHACHNLASALRSQFDQLGGTDTLAEAVNLHRQALSLRPPGHPFRPMSLVNLANTLKTRFEKFEDIDALTEAIFLSREALELRPHPHPGRPSVLTNLAGILSTRFMKYGLVSDLNEGLDLAREGIRCCSIGHPTRMSLFFTIGVFLLRPGTHIYDFRAGIHHLREGLRGGTSSPRHSLRFVIDALRSVENAAQLLSEYTDTSEPSPTDPSSIDRDDMILELYIMAIRLLPRAAGLELDDEDRLRELSAAEPVSRDGAARAIQAGRLAEAVEMLEEGRGVFWSQALRLRATNLDGLSAQDAQELSRLFRALGAENGHDESMTAVHRERRAEERRRLSDAAEALIADVRSRPDMGRFLLPPAFNTLMQSLPETGFVIMLVASELGYHALVISRCQTRTQSIVLVPPKGGSFSKAFCTALPRDASLETDLSLSRPLGISGRRNRTPPQAFEEVLAQLWILVVKPVIDVLDLKVR